MCKTLHTVVKKIKVMQFEIVSYAAKDMWNQQTQPQRSDFSS